MKIVISERFGGFGLSRAATERLRALGYEGTERELSRTDPRLIQVVEEMGDDASGRYATLLVITVPDGIQWHIHEYDGFETIHENHRSWGSEGLTPYC